MKEVKVLAILPYEELKANVRHYAANYPILSIDCRIGNLQKGLDLARSLLDQTHYDVILSRGGTAELLRKKLPFIPVVEINISFEDVFYAVMLARNYKENFAVVSFPFLTKQVHTLCELLDLDITIHNIHSEEEAKTVVEGLHRQGYTMIVGDVITAQMAREVGMNFVLIMSGKSSIRDALDNISQMLPLKYGIDSLNQHFAGLINHSPYMYMIMDDSYRILFSSFHEGGTRQDPDQVQKAGDYGSKIREGRIQEARDYEGRAQAVRDYEGRGQEARVYEAGAYDNQAHEGRKDIFSQYFSEHMERLAADIPIRRIFHIGKGLYQIHVERVKGDEGYYYYIYGEKIFRQEAEEGAGITLIKNANDEGYAFHSLHGAINSIGQTRETIYNCSRSPLPILILGEEGTGKDAAASSIYRRSGLSDNPYFVIDCEATSDREWYRFFNRTSSPLMHTSCTIHVKNVHRISQQNERRLRSLIEESMLCRRNKMIFSAVLVPGADLSPFVKYLRDDLQTLLLQTLPLRERKEDLKNILVIYLNELNIQFGKQIIGFEKAAEKEILDYQWPGNITQLKRVLRELVTVADAPYITAETVKTYIRNEIFSRADQTVTYNINLNQSLDDITYDVICAIMKQENMNQSSAAKRLGIGRTTVWRILKNHKNSPAEDPDGV